MKIVVVAGLDASLLNFRGPLLRCLVKLGHEVIAAAPRETTGVPEALGRMGVDYEATEFTRAGLNPVADLRALLRLREVLQRRRPDIVLSYTIKPVIYGSLAARMAGVPRIYALVTGLGSAFHASGFKGRLLRGAAMCLYRLAFRACARVLVQNSDIAAMFVREKLVEAEKISVVHGSGVDTEHFSPSPFPDGDPVFLYVGRLLRDKGIAELVSAAGLVQKLCPQVRVRLVGDIDPNPTSFSAEDLKVWQRDGIIEWLGFQQDVRPHLQRCTAVVLPSYHEGLPRSVLEAMAVGRPVITTDTIGCRETISRAGNTDAAGVRVGENGLLVPAKSIEPLAQAMIRLARDSSLCARMGERGRRLALERFDVRQINRQMLVAMDLEQPEASASR